MVQADRKSGSNLSQVQARALHFNLNFSVAAHAAELSLAGLLMLCRRRCEPLTKGSLTVGGVDRPASLHLEDLLRESSGRAQCDYCIPYF